ARGLPAGADPGPIRAEVEAGEEERPFLGHRGGIRPETGVHLLQVGGVGALDEVESFVHGVRFRGGASLVTASGQPDYHARNGAQRGAPGERDAAPPASIPTAPRGPRSTIRGRTSLSRGRPWAGRPMDRNRGTFEAPPRTFGRRFAGGSPASMWLAPAVIETLI